MPKYQCAECKKVWYGWAQPNLCPYCGKELVEVKHDHRK